MTRRSPSQYNWAKGLYDETFLTKHYTPRASRAVAFYVLHHMTIIGNGLGSALLGCWNTWQVRQASAHIGVEGRLVRRFVRDKDNAWAAGHADANNRGIHVEHSNSTAGPGWRVNEQTWKTGARVVGNGHRQHGLGAPSSRTIRRHHNFRSTLCPGPYMDSIYTRYIAEARRVYNGDTSSTSPEGLFGMSKLRILTRSKDVKVGKGKTALVPLENQYPASKPSSALIPAKGDIGFIATFDLSISGIPAGHRVRVRAVHDKNGKIVGASGWQDFYHHDGHAAYGVLTHHGEVAKGRRLRLQVHSPDADVTVQSIKTRVRYGR